MDIVTAKLSGRLGNNLFQIATACDLAVKNNATPIFDKKWEYSFFFDKLKYKDQKEIDNIVENTAYEKRFSFDKIDYCKNLKIIGYFQSCLYFDDYENINLLLRPREEVTNIIKEKHLEIIKNIYDFVFIHVRRTDYEHHDFYADLSKNGYYKRALESIDSNLRKVILSDDISWCEKNMRIENCIYFKNKEKNETLSSFIDFYIMSMAKNIITSNSTYSWWAAFLNRNLQKNVYCPKCWFTDKADHLDERDLIVKEWNLI